MSGIEFTADPAVIDAVCEELNRKERLLIDINNRSNPTSGFYYYVSYERPIPTKRTIK